MNTENKKRYYILYSRKYRKENPEWKKMDNKRAIVKYGREYFTRKMNNWRKRNPELYKKRLKDFFTKKLEKLAQREKPSRCDICGKIGIICFDHCHKTAKFRGWICKNCNFALGLVGDDIKILKKMINYLRK